MEKQTLYHGSNVIVEQPLVSIGRKDLDLVQAFTSRHCLNKHPNGLFVSRQLDEQNLQ